MSLRARLIIGLVSLAAVGLLLAGAITYIEQRNFLYDRVDQQSGEALRVVDESLREHGVGGSPISDGDGPAPQTGGAPTRGQGFPGHGNHGPRRDGGRQSLSTEIYGQGRDASGRILRSGWPTLPPGATTPSPPKLPADIQPGDRLTVRADDSGGPRYRVFARTSSTGGLVIAAIPIGAEAESLSTLLLTQGLVIGGVLLALAAGAWFIVRLGLRPLDEIGVTAGAIAAGDLSRRVEKAEPRTEVGRLGLSLNAMLERLDTAFAERRASEERLRRFLADAAHELRTPLSSIRGYAELFRIGAARDGADMEKAMSRIEAESARMGVLVEDLLALARLDEVRDAEREPVDLTALAGDAVDDARAVAPQRTITLHGRDEVVVDGDPGQLRQVLANLMRNALVHTPPEAAIEVSVGASGTDATLAVRDHGPGLPTDDPNELFDRFWRADRARGRGRAGAGLGLAIVAGIVTAHGGRAGAANAEGGGARFEVVLPLRDAARA